MRKNLVFGLLIVMILTAQYGYGAEELQPQRMRRRADYAEIATAEDAGKTSAISADNFAVSAVARFVYDSKDKRDPFIPLTGEGMKLLIPQGIRSIEGIILEGIIFDPERGSLAIINGEILREGQSVGGFTLSKVKEKNIVLTKDGEDYVINLIKESNEDTLYRNQ